MKTKLLRFLKVGVLLLASTGTALRAQVVNDGTTNTLNNITSNITGTVTVGTNGSFTLLILTNNALLTNSGHGVIGRNAGANSNVVRLAGGNTRWLMTLDHFVGSNASFNRLVISNGARVDNSFGSLGVGTTSSNNEALVTGAGSLWSNRNDLYVGYLGQANRLAVTNGGRVLNGSGLLGVDVTSSNNEAVVTGATSLWSNRASLFVGFSGRGNRVVVTNSGSVFASNNVQIGVNAGSVSNSLLLSSGALLTNNGNGIIGVNGSSNIASLSGVNTRWLLGNNLYVGSNGAFNQLVVSNAALLVNTSGHLGFRPASSNNVAVVTGVGTVWSNRAELDIGFDSDGNRLVVSSGGVVLDDLGVIGTGGISNQVLVTGTGSIWTNRTDLFVGAPGRGNLLVVSNGGRVFNRSGILGVAKVSPNNEAVVTGTGSLWSNRQHVVVGGFGDESRLTVMNGGTVFASTNVSVGLNVGCVNNFLLLSSGALLTNNGNGIIGGEADANTNMVFVSDVGTRWLLGNNLYVGSNGAFNQLVVSNAALLVNTSGHLGFRPASSNNVAVVTGVGTVWSNRAELDIGFDSDGNRLVVSSGGVVLDDLGVIGTGGISNQVLVTGTGSIWTNRTDLFVGAPGRGNLLVVSNGGRVFNRSGILGVAKVSPNNEAVVTGTGSLWSNRQHVVVGGFGDESRLTVMNGGTVFASTNVSVGLNVGCVNNFLLLSSGALLTNNGNGIIGGEADANTNMVFVSDVGTRWLLGNNLYVGSNGAFNQLVVSNAGSVLASGGAVLGFSPSSTNNRLLVAGGTLRSTNVSNTGLLEVRRGTNVLNAGLIEVDRLLITNTQGVFEFNGGTLVTEATTNNNGRAFAVGNGASTATLNLSGNGTHSFANGLTIRQNASLLGNGNIIGTLTVQSGGSVSPGSSVGRLNLSNAPVLQGVLLMEISKNGSVLTNDQVQTGGSLTYGGYLTVPKLGADALTAGNRFQLFIAASRGGAFTQVTLPALGSGLTWTNKLLLDGSIEVVGPAALQFGNIVLVGTNVILSGTGGPTNGTYWVLASTNVALPLTSWTRLLTNQFNSSGSFAFTNARSPALPRRFYVLQVP